MTLVLTSNPMTFDNLFRYFHITITCLFNFGYTETLKRGLHKKHFDSVQY